MVHPAGIRRSVAHAAHRLRLGAATSRGGPPPLVERVRAGLRHGRLVVAAALALALLAVPPRAERYGDALQIALPLAGFACAMGGGGAPQMLARFAVLELGIHGTKALLGDAPINRRPSGADKGFPSGHTGAAAFGASAILRHCLANAPLLQGTTIIAAGFTGASRIEAGKHTIWQVLAGVLWGLAAERGLRRGQRRRIKAWLTRRREGAAR